MGKITVDYRGEAARIFSPEIWEDFPWDDLHYRPWLVKLITDDFHNCPVFASTVSQKGYYTYQDTGVTMQGLATVGNIGVLEVAGNDADNDEGVLTTGGNVTGDFLISDTGGSDFPLWFECRIKKASIADNALSFFVGLAEEGVAAAEALVDDTGAMPDKDHIGFHCDAAAGETVDFVYTKAGQTDTVQIAGVKTLVADTYVLLGFKYEPQAKAAERIKVFVDGVEQTTFITATEIATADFPDGEELAMLLATKVGAAAESKFQMDWWACGQRT